MAIGADITRMVSRPARVRWAGWESTTTLLQRAGWKIAVHQDFVDYSQRMQVRLVMEHPEMELRALTHPTDYRPDSLSRYRFEANPDQPPEFTVAHVARRLECAQFVDVNWNAFQQIDATPQIVTHPVRSMEDFNIFALARKPEAETLIDKADMSVIEHLEAIKRLQEPKQHELRQRSLSEPRAELMSSIIRIGAAA